MGNRNSHVKQDMRSLQSAIQCDIVSLVEEIEENRNILREIRRKEEELIRQKEEILKIQREVAYSNKPLTDYKPHECVELLWVGSVWAAHIVKIIDSCTVQVIFKLDMLPVCCKVRIFGVEPLPISHRDPQYTQQKEAARFAKRSLEKLIMGKTVDILFKSWDTTSSMIASIIYDTDTGIIDVGAWLIHHHYAKSTIPTVHHTVAPTYIEYHDNPPPSC